MSKIYYRACLLLIIGLMALAVTACSQKSAASAQKPTGPAQSSVKVVSFATQVPATATPPPPTNTPLPTPIPVTATTAPTFTPQPATATPSPTPGITRVENENPLTGLVVDPAVFQRRPLHIRVGNDPAARPQINLSQADVVYEEIVEWWITRFTAVFYTNAPKMVAPIRSARLINTQLTQQYEAALVNSGGSDPVRWQLSQLPIVNLDEYFHPTPYFYREGEGWQKRLAINVAEAHNYITDEGLQTAVKLRGFAFSAEAPTGNPATSIYIDYPSKDSKVLWEYNADTGLYERSTGGEPMIDGATGAVIAAPNVIIYFAPHYETDIVEDSTGATSVGMDINGEGVAWIFRDGALITGRWRTDGTQTPEFIDAEDRFIPLRPGQTWIEVVPTDYEILVNDVPAE